MSNIRLWGERNPNFLEKRRKDPKKIIKISYKTLDKRI